jgi:branched-subunit amino acid ABC-type transport system permease component
MPALSVPLRKNLAAVSTGLLHLCAGVRSGNGQLSLSAVARSLPGVGTDAARKKYLWRLLANSRLSPEAMIPNLVRIVLGPRPQRLTPLLVDQTAIGAVQTILVGAIYQGRVLPLAFTCFTYAQIRKSQNLLETALLRLVAACFPAGTLPVFIADRAYGRSQLLTTLNSWGVWFILRSKRKVTFEIEGRRRLLRTVRARSPRPRRFAGVLYHATKRLAVDLIVHHDTRFKETWYLLAPAGSAVELPTEEIVRLYAERMQIEQGFRDWKTHLGVRGLKLQVRPAERMTRLLLAFALAYILVVLLGASKLGRTWRARFETPRRQPRHGTCAVLSVLSLGRLMLATAALRRQAWAWLSRLIHNLSNFKPALALVPDSPR